MVLKLKCASQLPGGLLKEIVGLASRSGWIPVPFEEASGGGDAAGPGPLENHRTR